MGDQDHPPARISIKSLNKIWPVSDSVRTVDQDGKSSFKTPLSFLWLVSLCTLDDSAQWLSYPNASSSQTSLMESEKILAA